MCNSVTTPRARTSGDATSVIWICRFCLSGVSHDLLIITYNYTQTSLLLLTTTDTYINMETPEDSDDGDDDADHYDNVITLTKAVLLACFLQVCYSVQSTAAVHAVSSEQCPLPLSCHPVSSRLISPYQLAHIPQPSARARLASWYRVLRGEMELTVRCKHVEPWDSQPVSWLHVHQWRLQVIGDWWESSDWTLLSSAEWRHKLLYQLCCQCNVGLLIKTCYKQPY